MCKMKNVITMIERPLVDKWCFKFYHFYLYKIERKNWNFNFFNNLMEKESIVVLELGFFASNIKNKVCGVFDFDFDF